MQTEFREGTIHGQHYSQGQTGSSTLNVLTLVLAHTCASPGQLLQHLHSGQVSTTKFTIILSHSPFLGQGKRPTKNCANPAALRRSRNHYREHLQPSSTDTATTPNSCEQWEHISFLFNNLCSAKLTELTETELKASDGQLCSGGKQGTHSRATTSAAGTTGFTKATQPHPQCQ